MNQKCAGCPNLLKGVNLLLCCRCPDKYHYSCVNFTKDDYTHFTKEFKDTWVCPSCRCKEPKRGDNSNTPIRCPASTSSNKKTENLGSSHENVTLRSKARTASSAVCVEATGKNCGCISPELLRDIIREELDRKLTTTISEIQLKLTTIDECLTFYNTDQEQAKLEIQEHKSRIQKLESENERLRNSTQDLSRRLQQLDQLSRANNIELQCVPEHKNENLYNTVQQLADVIKCPITDSGIQYCNRIAKFNTNSPRPRSILVKFSSRRLRDTFLAGVIKFNRNNPTDKLNTSHLGYGGQKKSPVFVSEHLLPETKALHAAARQKIKQINFKHAWVRDGKVFVRKTDNSDYIHIPDSQTLDKLT